MDFSCMHFQNFVYKFLTFKTVVCHYAKNNIKRPSIGNLFLLVCCLPQGGFPLISFLALKALNQMSFYPLPYAASSKTISGLCYINSF